MGSMTDCPFMQHEENLCPMDLLDHVQAWKSVFLFAVPQFISYLLTLYTGYAVLSRTDFFTLLRPPVHATRRYLRQAVAEYPLKPLQELYAAGILNPKLF
jgi:hypothetical protein